jgi:hypothetical protein
MLSSASMRAAVVRFDFDSWHYRRDADAAMAGMQTASRSLSGAEEAMTEELIRFIIGGTLVSAFAVLGDILKPKSFAGLFGAAPSLALATLVLAIVEKGAIYSSVEARSMIAGAIAFFVYACCVSYVLMRFRIPVVGTACLFLLLWLGVSLSLWAVCPR